MSMTKTEKATRSVIANFMRSQGYVTYAGLLLKFDLNFYRPRPGEIFTAAMLPGQYRILINPVIKDKEALSLFIRHEILHEYMKHFDRALKHLAENSDLNYDELDDNSLKELKKKLNNTHEIFNIAGDYEISNRGYTEEDKEIIRNLGPLLDSTDEIRGLVTEDDHPDWVDLPIEDMYDLLMKEQDQLKDLFKKLNLDKFLPPDSDKKREKETSPDKDDDGGGDGSGPSSEGDNTGDDNTGDGTEGDDIEGDGTESDGSGSSSKSSTSPDENSEENPDSSSGSKGSSSNDDSEGTSDEGGSDTSDNDENSSESSSDHGDGNSADSSNSDHGDGDSSDSGSEGPHKRSDSSNSDDDSDDYGSGDELNDKSPRRAWFDDYDEKELEKQDAERESEIEKELDELEDVDPYSSDAESKLEEIGDLLNDKSVADAIFDETDRKVRASRKQKREIEKASRKEAEKYEAKQGIDNFILDLNKLIKNEIKKIKKSDWSKYNKKADGTGLIRPGKSQKKNPSIPKLYVYFDQSGSWTANDIEIGEQAIATLNTFVKSKKLIINLFYFAEKLTTTPGHAANGYGWECFDKVAEHIKTYKPDNVVIMTDSDGDYYDSYTGIYSMNPVTVNGGMFLLFRGGAVSKQVVRVFKGKKLTKIYKF